MTKRALIVDDDFFFVEFLAELLVERRGYEVVKAYDGKEGLTKLEDGPFDILFCDLIMPKIDGTQFIKLARSKYPDSPFRIIAVSGSVVEQMPELADVDVDCFLAKGPLEQMEMQILGVLDQMETGAFGVKEGGILVEPGTLYPRQITGELLDALNFHKGIIESIGVGILVVDRDGRVLHATSEALELMHASLPDILNRHVTSLFPKKERPVLVEALKAVIRNQSLKKVRIHMLLNAGTSRLTVSLLRVARDIVGWVIAMEETEE